MLPLPTSHKSIYILLSLIISLISLLCTKTATEIIPNDIKISTDISRPEFANLDDDPPNTSPSRSTVSFAAEIFTSVVIFLDWYDCICSTITTTSVGVGLTTVSINGNVNETLAEPTVVSVTSVSLPSLLPSSSQLPVGVGVVAVVLTEGIVEINIDGIEVGVTVGLIIVIGLTLGFGVGENFGVPVGFIVGDGLAVGETDGFTVGDGFGVVVFEGFGDKLGFRLGTAVIVTIGVGVTLSLSPSSSLLSSLSSGPSFSPVTSIELSKGPLSPSG